MIHWRHSRGTVKRFGLGGRISSFLANQQLHSRHLAPDCCIMPQQLPEIASKCLLLPPNCHRLPLIVPPEGREFSTKGRNLGLPLRDFPKSSIWSKISVSRAMSRDKCLVLYFKRQTSKGFAGQ